MLESIRTECGKVLTARTILEAGHLLTVHLQVCKDERCTKPLNEPVKGHYFSCDEEN